MSLKNFSSLRLYGKSLFFVFTQTNQPTISLATSFKQTKLRKFVIVPKLFALPLIALEEENLKIDLD